MMALLLIGATSDGQASERTYSNHIFSFQIPANWSVTKDAQSANDTQIVLSDGTSKIIIDIVELPQVIWLTNSTHDEFIISEVVLGWYQKNFVLGRYQKKMQEYYGLATNCSVAMKPQPDGIERIAFCVIGGEGQD